MQNTICDGLKGLFRPFELRSILDYDHFTMPPPLINFKKLAADNVGDTEVYGILTSMNTNLFSYVKSQISIVDVISSYVQLKKLGGYYKGSCPFHAERTASFTVTPDRHIFYCFGCHATGDVIAFIAKAEHCSQVEAAKQLVDRYQLTPPQQLLTTTSAPDVRKRHYDLCEMIAQWCIEQRKKQPAASAYFAQRGFTESTLEQFQIGYFPGTMPALKSLISFVGTKQFLVADLLERHLVESSRNALYSPLQERLIFPIKDHLGRVCGFGGRIFKPQDTRPKYYNSKEHEFFNKGSLLFGFDQAKKKMHETGAVYLVEGYTDCMAMAQHGYLNTVATLGTACTLEHLKQLSRHVHTLYALYDGDAAGQKAMLRLAELCWEVNLEPRVITLPASHDPASLLQKESLEPYISQARDIFVFYIDSLGHGFVQMALSEKLRVAQRLIDLITKVQDSLKRDLLIQRASEVLGIPFNSLAQQVNKEAQASAPATEPAAAQTVSQLEKKLFTALLIDDNLWQTTQELFADFHPMLQAILTKLVASKAGGEPFETLLTDPEKIIVNRALSMAVQEQMDNSPQLVEQFQKKHWKTLVTGLKQQIARAEREHNPTKVQELLTTFQALKSTMLK